MLFLQLLVLAVLFQVSENVEALQGPTSYHVMQISSFTNSTWTENRGSGWLEDLQIHRWDSETGTAIFLKPWSKGNLSDEEITELVELFRVYFFGLVRELRDHVTEFQMKYPFELQGIAGCELHSGGVIKSFLRGGLGGQDFLSLRNHSCWPAPEGGISAKKVCTLIAQYRGITEIVGKLIFETCPRYLLGVLEAGKAELRRQVKPRAWLSSGPNPGPGRLLLVCHVSGFYPKPVWARWMQGEQEKLAQRNDTLPYADGTWYLRVTLDVAAGEASGLSCRVKHSSLGNEDIILYWGSSISIGMIFLAIIVSGLIFLLFLALWFWRRRSYQNIL
ncbi:T-cell surface glycoprotein CD1b isoform X2 [Oryctolagus cuniculus]|uniref:CD1b molecule n=1 Tax=Oryctolagus cuniculus TaxID=9986 RepID=G1T0Z4_RABIT|nr:T-cell surface glycoprotein CD1b isoform X2 [Oryctolagus cuniculus]